MNLSEAIDDVIDNKKNEPSFTYTENGELAVDKTMSACVDFIGRAGAMRIYSDKTIISLFKDAWKENSTYALRLLFYVRDFRDNHGIWGAIDELMNGHGEEVSKNEYDKLVQTWINEYNEEQPRYYDPINDSYFRVHNKVKLKELNKYDCDAVVYSYDGVLDPQYVRPAEEFYKLCIKK